MANLIGNRLNRPLALVVPPADINNAASPIVAVTFALDYGEVFRFKGIRALFSSSEPVAPGEVTMDVEGFLGVTPGEGDTFQSIRSRVPQGDRLYAWAAIQRVGTTQYELQDFFPEPIVEAAAGQYMYSAAVRCPNHVFAESYVIQLTVYGERVPRGAEGRQPRYRPIS